MPLLTVVNNILYKKKTVAGNENGADSGTKLGSFSNNEAYTHPAGWRVCLGIYPRETETYVHTETCTGLFVAALLVLALNCKQPKNSTAGK